MRSGIFQHADKEIGWWSAPLIADSIYGAYEQLLGGKSEMSDSLARQHCRLWRSLLENDVKRAQQTKIRLFALIRLAHLNEAALDEIDTDVLENLLDVILRRNAGGHETARVDGKALVRAASALGEIRHAA
jgi:hypothetical protein